MRTVKERKIIALVSMFLNLLILPGMGTLLEGDQTHGLKQLITYLIGFVLIFTWSSLTFLGAAMCLAAWGWGAASSIQILKAAY